MNGTFLNFMEITFATDTMTIYFCDYKNKDWFKKLRDENKELAFLKDSKNSIVYVWNRDGSEKAIVLSGITLKQKNISIDQYSNLISRMIERKVISVYNKDDIRIYPEKYSNSWVLQNRKQLFLNDENLLINRCVKINSCHTKVNDQIIFGIVLSTELKYSFLASIEKLRSIGVPTGGLVFKNERICANLVSKKRYVESKGLVDALKKCENDNNALKKQYSVITGTLSDIAKNINGSSINGVTISCKRLENLTYDNGGLFNVIDLPNPKRYFCDGKEQIDFRLYQNNLKTLKPHSYNEFNKPLKIAVLFSATDKGTVENFMTSIEKLFKEYMHIPKINYEQLILPTPKFESYKLLTDSNAAKLKDCHLAIIVVSDSDKKISDINASPYHYCKAKFLGQGIPTQEITIENIRKDSIYTKNNFVLNSYAKIGGTPWTIEQINPLTKEFIIGVSSSYDFEKNRSIGFANIFNAEGKYCTGDCISLCEINDYKKNFEETLGKQLSKVITTNNEEIRLIFHLFKSPANNTEIDALEKIIKEYEDKAKIEFAFVKASFAHNFRIFENDGNQDVRSGKSIYLNEYQSIINYTKSVPALITIDYRSTFKDIFYISKQMYWFSHLSVRSYRPSYKAISLLYPQLMMRLLNKLKLLPNWDKNILAYSEEKLWFV